MSKKSSKPKKETQEDFWDLGDDELDIDESPEEVEEDQKKEITEAQDEPAAEGQSGEDEEEKEAQEESPEVEPENDKSPPAKTEEKSRKIKPLEHALDELGDLEDDEEEGEVAEDESNNGISEQPTPQPQPKLVRVGKGKRDAKPVSTIEKISLALTIVLLIGIFAWGVSMFYRDAPEGELVTFDEDFPIQGENVTVESVDTWWRKPVRTGENADPGVVIDVNLIPCARVKISDGDSTTLQISFRDDEENLVGDTINLVVSGGKFERNGGDEIVVNSTSGFTNPSRLNAYANEDIDPWSLTITENSSGSSSSETLVKARISASTQDKK